MKNLKKKNEKKIISENVYRKYKIWDKDQTIIITVTAISQKVEQYKDRINQF